MHSKSASTIDETEPFFKKEKRYGYPPGKTKKTKLYSAKEYSNVNSKEWFRLIENNSSYNEDHMAGETRNTDRRCEFEATLYRVVCSYGLTYAYIEYISIYVYNYKQNYTVFSGCD